MLGEQPIANAANAGTHLRLAAGLDREVALGIHAHRASREVGGANAQQLVIHDHHFGMDERRHIMRPRRDRVDEPQPAVTVRGLHPLERRVAKRPHRLTLEPSGAFFRRHDHHFGAVGLLESRGQRVGHAVRP